MKLSKGRIIFYVREIFFTLLILVMSIFMLYQFKKLFVYLQNSFKGTDKDILVALIVAGSTVIVSVLSLVIGKYIEKKKEIENSLREKKIPVYEEFVQFTFKVFNHEIDFAKNPEKANKGFMDITQKLIVWGSDEVVNKWILYRNNSQSSSPKNILFDMENLLLAIRRDLGHKNYSMIKGDLLSMFVKDVPK